METFILDNRKILEKMADGSFSGSVTHEWRALFKRHLIRYAPNQVVEWNCNCDSVQRAAKIILRHNP